MSRIVSTGFRENVESIAAEDLPVFLVTISHATLEQPIRVNSDIVDYVYNGDTYYGSAVAFSLLTDDESPPQAKISIHNVDPRIGEAVLAISSAPRMDFDLVMKSDFTDDDPRTAIGTPTVELSVRHLFLRNVSCNALMLTADIGSYDITSEPWPKLRSTAEFVPDLFQ